jgi:hypothetical protein
MKIKAITELEGVDFMGIYEFYLNERGRGACHALKVSYFAINNLYKKVDKF